jgi:tRNA A37 threonylcarbamoyladenosine biosynthesis protein TsaE
MLAAGGVVLIEWPERIAPLLPADRLEVRLEPEGEARRLTLSSIGPRSAELIVLLPQKQAS